MYAAGVLPCSIRWAFNFKEWKPTAKEWEFAAQCVQKEEKDRVYRFVYAQDAKASMIGQLLMRKASSECTDVPYDELRFSRTESGKPFISNPTSVIQRLNYNFNISHHGDYCVLAAQKGCCVGIDIMKTEYSGSRPLTEYFQLMQKQFSFDEMEFIRSPGLEAEQINRFYRLWCLKESFVKAKGTGISYNLKSISFHCPTPCLRQSIITNDTDLTIDGVVALNWKFEETLLDKNHCVAVAVEHVENENANKEIKVPLKFSFLSYADLMKNSVGFESTDEEDWLTFSQKEEKPS